MSTSAAGAAHPSPLLGQRLRREWVHLRRRPDAIRRAAGWQIVEGSIHDLDQVLAAVGYGVAATPAHETALRGLVVRARTDQLAARVVLQRILPGLLAIARRRGRGAEHPFDELIGAAWIAVTTFDPTRTPRCLAAALIDDAAHRAFRAPRRRASAREVPSAVDAEQLADPAHLHPIDELTELFELAVDVGVPPGDIDLLRRILGARCATDVATDLGVTTRTVRNRRAAVTGRLRELALAA